MPNASITESGRGSSGAPAAPLPGRLRRQAVLEAAGHFAALLLFGLALQRLVPAKGLLAGSGVAALSLGVVHGLLWRHLAGNRRPGEPGVASTLGLANRITLLRGLLISLAAGSPLWVSQDPAAVPLVAWLPGGLYLAAAILDGVDGAWARRSGTTTPLGKALDVQYDALGVLVACAVAVAFQRLPAYYLTAGGAYYVYRLGLWCRRRRGKAVYPAGSRTFARLVAGCQMGFLGIALLPLLSPPVLAAAAPVFLLPLLAGFAWDWAVASGRVGDAGARRGAILLAALVAKGPLVLRGGLLVAAVRFMIVPEAPMSGAGRLALGLTFLVAGGLAGRTAALLLSLLMAYHASVAGAAFWMMAMMTASLTIVLTGTGDYSLWRPEDPFVLREDGGRPQAVSGTPMTLLKKSPFRSPAAQVLTLAVVAGLLYWTLRDVSLGMVGAAVGRWRGDQWGLFAALNLLILGAMCWRWSFILRRMGYRVGFAALVGYRMAANTLSYITPGPQFGGEPLQLHCLVGRHQVPGEAAAAAVGVDRLAELMGNLIFLSLAGLMVLPALLGEKTSLLPVITAMAVAVLGIGLLLAAIGAGGTPITRMAARAASWIGQPPVLAGAITFLEAGERRAAGLLTDRLWGWYVLGGLFQWSGFLAELWLIYRFTGIVLDLTALLTVAVAARLAFLLPLPGGLGALEASQMLAITSLGGDPAVAAAACGIMRVRDLVLIPIGGALALRWMRPVKPQRPLEPA